jgi:hypothetical protein
MFGSVSTEVGLMDQKLGRSLPGLISEFVDRGNRMGVSHDARLQAAAIGASLVWFSSTPAKLRAIKRRRNGTINMASVLADPPASLSPRGYYVVRAVFLARLS